MIVPRWKARASLALLASGACSSPPAAQPTPDLPGTGPAALPAPSPAASGQAPRVSASAAASNSPAPSAPATPALACRRPWDCQADPALVGITAAAAERRLGRPYLAGPRQLLFRLPGSCKDPSQHLALQLTDGLVVAARFYWRLGDRRCLPGLPDRESTAPFRIDCGPHVEKCPAAAKLAGKQEDDVIRGLGLPHRVEGGVWSYHSPRGCSDRRATLSLVVRAGKVAEVAWKSRWTGEHCVLDL